MKKIIGFFFFVLNSLGQNPTAVVVVDPQVHQRDCWWDYYRVCFDERLSRLAKAEVELTLESRGFKVLVSPYDVGPIQDELKLENSPWGERGENRQPIGEFAGATYIFYVAGYLHGGNSLGGATWRAGGEAGGVVEEIIVGVTLRQIETRTRRQINFSRGLGRVRTWMVLRGLLATWNPATIQATRIRMEREAVKMAVEKAIENLPPAIFKEGILSFSPTTVEFLGVGEWVEVSQPLELEVSAPPSTRRVVFGLQSNNKIIYKAEDFASPFRIFLSPEMLWGRPPFFLFAVAYDREGKKLGEAKIRVGR